MPSTDKTTHAAFVDTPEAVRPARAGVSATCERIRSLTGEVLANNLNVEDLYMIHSPEALRKAADVQARSQTMLLQIADLVMDVGKEYEELKFRMDGLEK